jgi:hypothetical protein
MPQNLFSGRFPLPQKVHFIRPTLLFKRHFNNPAFEQQFSNVMRIPAAVLQGLREISSWPTVLSL